MTVSYPLTPPNVLGHATVEWQPINIVASSKNPYNLKSTTVVWPGDCWKVRVALPVLVRAEADDWEAFLLALRGKTGTFWMQDMVRKTTRGGAAGTPLTDGATVEGLGYISTKGWTPNQTNVLCAGDLIQIGNSMYKVLNYVSVGPSGACQIDVWPSARSHAGDTAIVTANAKCLMRLCEPMPSMSIDELGTTIITFSAEEAL